jgi:SAM-dependent methyltransferase
MAGTPSSHRDVCAGWYLSTQGAPMNRHAPMRFNEKQTPLWGRLANALKEPEVSGESDPDSDNFSVAHRKVLLRKPVLRALFMDLYRKIRTTDLSTFGQCPGRRLDIGSGSGFVRELFPDVVTSDLKPLPWLSLTCDAERMPFRNDSLRAISGINVFHHLPHPRAFFAEADRVLHPGGGVVLVDVHHGPLARFLTTRIHECEGFDADAPSWEAPISGPFTGANQALRYIVFHRDRAQFEREFPRLKIVSDTPHTSVWYYASGGVNFRPLVPSAFTPVLRWLDRTAMRPLNRWFALLSTVVLRKEC